MDGILLNSSRNLTLNNGTTATIDTQAFSMSIAGSLGGQGSLAKTGSGTLVLSGSNTYSGGTQINAGISISTATRPWASPSAPLTFTGNGTLRAGADGILLNSNRNITVNSGGTATIDTQAFDISIAGAINNQGGLAKAGAGTLTLMGSINGSGNFFLTSGGLAINNREQGAPGASLVMSGNTTLGPHRAQYPAIVVAGLAGRCGRIATGQQVLLGGNSLKTGLDNSNTTFSGTISGSGGLIKSGNGTFTLAGTNIFGGGTTLNGGELSLGQQRRFAGQRHDHLHRRRAASDRRQHEWTIPSSSAPCPGKATASTPTARR